MGVEKKNCAEKNFHNKSNVKLSNDMWSGDWVRFKVADCKSVEVNLITGSNPVYSYAKVIVELNQKSKHGAVGSASVLGTEGHVFESRCFDSIFFKCANFKNAFDCFERAKKVFFFFKEYERITLAAELTSRFVFTNESDK